MLEGRITTGSLLESQRSSIIGSQKSIVTSPLPVRNGYSEFGRNVLIELTKSISTLQRAFVQLGQQLIVSMQCLARSVRKLISLRHVNQATASTPRMGNILACFRWVAPKEQLMDMHLTHMFSPYQHTVISLQAVETGHPGRASRNKWYECHTTKYQERVALYDPRVLYKNESSILSSSINIVGTLPALLLGCGL